MQRVIFWWQNGFKLLLKLCKLIYLNGYITIIKTQWRYSVVLQTMISLKRSLPPSVSKYSLCPCVSYTESATFLYTVYKLFCILDALDRGLSFLYPLVKWSYMMACYPSGSIIQGTTNRRRNTETTRGPEGKCQEKKGTGKTGYCLES